MTARADAGQSSQRMRRRQPLPVAQRPHARRLSTAGREQIVIGGSPSRHLWNRSLRNISSTSTDSSRVAPRSNADHRVSRLGRDCLGLRAQRLGLAHPGFPQQNQAMVPGDLVKAPNFRSSESQRVVFWTDEETLIGERDLAVGPRPVTRPGVNHWKPTLNLSQRPRASVLREPRAFKRGSRPPGHA